jgi:hypothetical protein
MRNKSAQADHRRSNPYAGRVNAVERELSISRERGSIGWWYAGMVLDLIHMPLVIALVLLGATWWNGPVYVAIITVVVILQVATLGCPVMALTGWMKRKHDPTYQGEWSFTFWLYHRYGRLVGIAVFAFFLLLAILVRLLLF